MDSTFFLVFLTAGAIAQTASVLVCTVIEHPFHEMNIPSKRVWRKRRNFTIRLFAASLMENNFFHLPLLGFDWSISRKPQLDPPTGISTPWIPERK